MSQLILIEAPKANAVSVNLTDAAGDDANGFGVDFVLSDEDLTKSVDLLLQIYFKPAVVCILEKLKEERH